MDIACSLSALLHPTLPFILARMEVPYDSRRTYGVDRLGPAAPGIGHCVPSIPFAVPPLIVAFLFAFLFWVSIFSMLCWALELSLSCFASEMLAIPSRVALAFGSLPMCNVIYYHPYRYLQRRALSQSEGLRREQSCISSHHLLPHLPCPPSSIFLSIFFYFCFLTSAFLGRRGHSHPSTPPSLSRTFVHPPVSAFHGFGYFIRASSTCALVRPCLPILIEISVLIWFICDYRVIRTVCPHFSPFPPSFGLHPPLRFISSSLVSAMLVLPPQSTMFKHTKVIQHGRYDYDKGGS